MKNLILYGLVLICLFAAGCDKRDEQFIELNRAEAGNTQEASANVVTVETTYVNNDQPAGDEDISQPVVVYVCGCVKNAGVYELESGSRIFDAITAAGGLTGDANEKNLNLARLITDEQMIYVPSVDEEDTDAALSLDQETASDSDSSGLININTATAEQLMTIPGIGQSKADKIINYRNENGGFKTPEDIMQISGIKEGMYSKIKDYICVK